MSLADLNSNRPSGKSLLGEGDNELRTIVTKLLAFAGVEHTNAGIHCVALVVGEHRKMLTIFSKMDLIS